ncbi:hypothetical protein [Bradyrhizobium sp.]|uniref:hypothetical protein n=1 Tax=Bradyrhizobium sp. TaxID=376 RepID=UPI003D12BCAF
MGKDRLGHHPSRRDVGNFLMGGAQQGGCAKAEDQDGCGQDDCGEQKTDSREHGLGFRQMRLLRPSGNAVITGLAAFAAANQAESRIQ